MLTERDTPSTARTEAWEYVRRLQDDGAFFRQQVDIDQAIDDFAAGAEWALAQVREGLEAVVRTKGNLGPRVVVPFADALAVVDRLEGKP